MKTHSENNHHDQFAPPARPPGKTTGGLLDGILGMFTDDVDNVMKVTPIRDDAPEEQQSLPEPSVKTNGVSSAETQAEIPLASAPTETKAVVQTVKIIKNRPQKTPLMLPNGMVGKPYAVKLDLTDDGEIVSPTIVEADVLGVRFDQDTLEFCGTPVTAGEHALTLRYVAFEPATCPHCLKDIGSHFKNLPLKQKEKAVALKWIVNADPQSLWKNLPADASAPYARPDSAIASLSVGGRNILAASQRGRSHAHVGSFRDDSFCIDYDPGTKTSFIIVADGAGSAKYSRKGSEIACDVVLQQLRMKMAGDFWGKLPPSVAAYRDAADKDAETKKVRNLLYDSFGNAVIAANRAILEESKTQKSTTIKDYATTLLVAVCRPLDDGWFVGAYWVGDGGIGIYRKNDNVLLLGEPDGGEFAGQTRFLTMPEILSSGGEILRRIRFEMVEDFTAVVVMTDGVTDPKFQTDNNLQRKEMWDELWHELQPVLDSSDSSENAEQRLLQWLDFWSPGNHDDRTIAVML